MPMHFRHQREQNPEFSHVGILLIRCASQLVNGLGCVHIYIYLDNPQKCGCTSI
jgi:hypothetical protein